MPVAPRAVPERYREMRTKEFRFLDAKNGSKKSARKRKAMYLREDWENHSESQTSDTGFCACNIDL